MTLEASQGTELVLEALGDGAEDADAGDRMSGQWYLDELRGQGALIRRALAYAAQEDKKKSAKKKSAKKKRSAKRAVVEDEEEEL